MQTGAGPLNTPSVKIIVIILVIGLGLAFTAEALAEDDTPAELSRQIAELSRQAKYKDAVLPAEKLLALTRNARGDGDLQTIRAISTLALLYDYGGEYAKAEPLCKEALEICQKVLGPEHPDTARSLNNLAELYQHTGEYAKAEPLCREALQIRRKVLGPEHPVTGTSRASGDPKEYSAR